MMFRTASAMDCGPGLTRDARCQTCTIRDRALFGTLPVDDLAGIHRFVSETEHDTDAVVYIADDRQDAIFTLRSGYVKLVRFLRDGQQRVVRLVMPGCTFGLEALVGCAYGHTAIVLEKAVVCRIPTSTIEDLRRTTPELHTQLMRRWQIALDQADGWLAELSTGKAPQRLAHLLLRVIDADGNAPLFSREDIGAMLAITTEHASRVVVDFRKNGVIAESAPGRCRCDRRQLDAIARA